VSGNKIARLVCGRWTKWVVLAFWLIAFILIAPLAGKLTGAEKNDVESWLPGSAESTQVVKAQQQLEPNDQLSAIIVYERISGITAADRAKVTSDIAAYRNVDGVVGEVQGPAPSADGKALAVSLSVKFDRAHLDQLTSTIKKLKAAGTADANGLNVHLAGRAPEAADTVNAFAGVDTALLYTTLGVVIFVLLLTYRSLILWLFPVITAIISLTAAQAVIYLLAHNSGLVVNGQDTGILTVLVFGAATDYALLLVARYREELRRHRDRHDAMAVALHRAGPAIIASAGTVIAGTLCLMIALMNSTRGLGPVAAIGIAIGLLTTITLLPALLVIFGRWIFWPLKPRYGSAEHSGSGIWARIGRAISGRPRLVWIVTTLALLGLATGVAGLKANGLSQADTYVTKPESVIGTQLLAAHFPAGSGEPVVVIGDPAAATQIHDAMAGTTGLTDVTPAQVVGGYALALGTTIDPPSSGAAEATVDRVRAAVHAIPGAKAKVGGITAVNLDVERASRVDRTRIIPLVLLVVLVILGLLLRALVAPVVLIATVVLSFFAALGASALLFNHVFGFHGADTQMPLLAFVFLVALGIDYNIFLTTRIREESARHGTRRGALIGLTATGGVITSAGLVLAGTFATLGTLPLVSLAEVGIAVALGVLLDTIIVRSVLVTALTLDIDRWMWWPSALTRRRSTQPLDAPSTGTPSTEAEAPAPTEEAEAPAPTEAEAPAPTEAEAPAESKPVSEEAWSTDRTG
jgi:RND superfamily putative drug exporter